jgi:hypothetical protein
MDFQSFKWGEYNPVNILNLTLNRTTNVTLDKYALEIVETKTKT